MAITCLIQLLLWPCYVDNKISYYLLQEPHTLHQAVQSDALPSLKFHGLYRARLFGAIVKLVALCRPPKFTSLYNHLSCYIRRDIVH